MAIDIDKKSDVLPKKGFDRYKHYSKKHYRLIILINFGYDLLFSWYKLWK